MESIGAQIARVLDEGGGISLLAPLRDPSTINSALLIHAVVQRSLTVNGRFSALPKNVSLLSIEDGLGTAAGADCASMSSVFAPITVGRLSLQQEQQFGTSVGH